jgi:hypothetical protein
MINEKNGKIYFNDIELVRYDDYVLLKQTVDQLTKDKSSHVYLSDMYPSYLNGRYDICEQKFTLYSGLSSQQFVKSNQSMYVRRVDDEVFDLVVYSISIDMGKRVFRNQFELESPKWMVIRMTRNPDLTPPLMNHIDHFVKVQACLGDDTSIFGNRSYPDHPRVTFDVS